MLSWSKPTSSASRAAASVTDAGASPALGTRQDLREEGQRDRQHLVRGLGVGVVAGAVEDGQLAEVARELGDDLLSLRPGVDPVGVQAAHDDEDGTADVPQL